MDEKTEAKTIEQIELEIIENQRMSGLQEEIIIHGIAMRKQLKELLAEAAENSINEIVIPYHVVAQAFPKNCEVA